MKFISGLTFLIKEIIDERLLLISTIDNSSFLNLIEFVGVLISNVISPFAFAFSSSIEQYVKLDSLFSITKETLDSELS